MNFKILITVLTLAVSGIWVTAEAQVNLEKKSVSPEKFKKLVEKKHPVIIDVRTPAEFEEGHIPGAINIDVEQTDFIEQIRLLDKKKSYLVYCKSGRRSEKAMSILHENSLKKLYHLEGGYIAWTAAGYPVE